MLESSGSASLCFHKASLLLVIFLNSLFSYQGSSAVLRQLLYFSSFFLFCQPLFYFFQRFLSEDLLFSVLSADSFHRIPPTEAFVNRYFQYFLYFLYFLFYFYYFLFVYVIHLNISLFYFFPPSLAHFPVLISSATARFL